MASKLLVIDGHSMAFRAFYALPPDRFTTSAGQHTNAVYGFLSMMAKLLDQDRPSHVAVAFDAAHESFRNDEYPEYKAGRSETPPEFQGQVELIRSALDALGIVQTQVPGFEADDIIATLATRAREDGFEVLIASGDRDTFQLIGEETTVIYPGRSTQDLIRMTPERALERYGVPASQYPEIAALVGESADNLPGVPGVGEKTAAQWLTKYGGLESLLENAEKIGGKRGEALREHLDDVRRNRRLNHLRTDMSLDIEPEDCVPTPPDRLQVETLFDDLEIRALRQRVFAAMAPMWGDAVADAGAAEVAPVGAANKAEVVAVLPGMDLAPLLGRFLDDDGAQLPVAVWGEGHLAATEADLVAVALAGPGLILVMDAADLDESQHGQVGQFLAAHQNLAAHGAKALSHAIASQGWTLAPVAFDTELAAYLTRPGLRSYSLSVVTRQVLKREASEEEADALLSLAQVSGEDSEVSAKNARLSDNAATVLELVDPLQKRLARLEQLSLLKKIEQPVSEVLSAMEAVGIAIDAGKLQALRAEFAGEAERAAQDAYAAIGHETHLGSPKQLQTVLFEELDMPKTRKTKTGYTTDAEALGELYARTQHPFLEALLRHRDRTKLIQMIDGLLGEIQPDGRIHTTFQQTVSVTGRIASSDPNLQNIPARSDAGIRMREAFVAGPGFDSLMSVDYSQIEMRIMAHLSRDADLIEAFNSGEDLHRTMAAAVFGVPISEVTHELRNRIKATSYGLAYGLSPYGLSRQLGVSVDEAKQLHRQYFERFGGIGDYLHSVVREAGQTGYTETMLGRRRYFPELHSEVRRTREAAERAALNAPIQGSAADIIKLAMIDVAARLRDGHYKSRVLLQVHDELVLEIAPGESREVRELVVKAMGSPVDLSVDLDVAVGEGWSWRDAAH